MSGLFASLNASVSALNAHSRAVEIAGKNLANVNNTSYARQRVVYGDRGTVITPQGAESLGLEALGVEQLRDKLLDRQVLRESSLSSYYQSMQSAYKRAQAGLGQSISSTSSASNSSTTDTGVSAAMDDFFNSFQGFAANPTDSGQRATLVQSTSILTDRLHLADARLSQVQDDLDSQVNDDVTSVNTLLSTIADLNGQIGRFEINSPGSAVDLRDQRQTALESLAAKLPVSVTDSNASQVQVSVKDTSGNDVVLVSLATVPNTIAFDGTKITAGTSATPIALASGSIQGAIDSRDGAIKTLRDNLDQLSKQLVTSVNAIYNPSGTAGNFFDSSGTTAATIALDSSVSATSLRATNSGAAGDNDVALAVAQLTTKQFSTSGTPADAIDGTLGSYLSSSVSTFGQALSGANARVTDQENIEQLVRSQRDAVSGVSLDEEMADLMKYQRAFQASSRVFQTIDNLLDVVVNQLGR
jgi:flagellar hook-associated protein 1 FlgK